MRDPALLEYVGTRLYKARVFPIPATGEVKVALEYTEQIAVSNGLGSYRYPLNTEKFSSAPLRDVTIAVTLTSGIPLKSVFSPSHDVDVTRRDDKSVRVGYEAHNVRPDRDFVVCFQMSEAEFGLSLLSFRPAAEDGFFMARIAPPLSGDKTNILPKDVCFVFDSSGSMAGEKMDQARSAMTFCLRSLRPEDRFNVISFATEVRPFRDAMVPASSENVDAAVAEVDEVRAAGGTNINEALLKAIGMSPAIGGNVRALMIVFITDGQPTIDERDPEKIQANVRKLNGKTWRLFVFGVGNDLNAACSTSSPRTTAAPANTSAKRKTSRSRSPCSSRRSRSPCSPTSPSNSAAPTSNRSTRTNCRPVLRQRAGHRRPLQSRRHAHGDDQGTPRRRAARLEYRGEFASGRTANDFLPRLWARERSATSWTKSACTAPPAN